MGASQVDDRVTITTQLKSYRFRPLVAGILLVFGAAATAVAQDQTPGFASVFLPADHWAVEAARKLSVLGVTGRRFAWGEGSLTQREVGRALHYAASTPLKDPAVASLARSYWRRFASEFPATSARLQGMRDAAGIPMEGMLLGGVSSRSGYLIPGRTTGRYNEESAQDPTPASDLFAASGQARFSALLSPYLSGTITPERWNGDWRIAEGYGVLALGKASLWFGRRPMDFGPGVGGGIIYNATVPFDGGGFSFTEPVTLPWIFRYLGPTRFETFLSRIDSSASIRHPFFLGSHVSFTPHPRLLIGGTMGAMFGGDSVAPITWSTLWSMFRSHGINAAGSEFENAMASVEIRYRPPVPVLPLVLYLEWGSEDNHEAWAKWPAIVAGVEVPAVPGLPALSVGLERTSFSTPCVHCAFYATWYRHYMFEDGWSIDRIPLGHPLGGTGTEWLAYTRLDMPERRMQLSGRAFVRNRGAYNIYSDTHRGRSVGGRLSTEFQASRYVNVVLEASLEDGEDWHQSSTFAGLRLIF